MKRIIGLLLFLGLSLAQQTTTITFYFPVGVAGPLARYIESYIHEFEEQNPSIKVETIFGGDYNQNQAKVLAAIKAGNPPDVAILLSQQLRTLVALHAVVPISPYLKQDPRLKKEIEDIFPAFMLNSVLNGEIYSVPFQRSTPILFYNKEAFRQAGLNPNDPPTTWSQLIEDAKKLTLRDAQGNVVRYGVEIPTEDHSTWLLEALTIEAGGLLYDPKSNGCRVLINSKPVQEGIQFKADLARKYHVSPEGIISWNTAPGDFVAGKVAMIYHSTGSLSYIREHAHFPFGTAFLPKKVRYGVPTGGGNLYLIQGADPAKRQAALKLIEFLVSAPIQARWSIDSGYTAVRRASWQLPLLKEYAARWPQVLTALRQLPYAKAELPVYNLQRIKDIVARAEQSVVLSEANVIQATELAQQEADQALQPYCH
jgi:sn-glycerol 3-phosphate transport system substrate-binding protein